MFAQLHEHQSSKSVVDRLRMCSRFQNSPKNQILVAWIAQIAYPKLIEKYVGGELVVLGTDGFGAPGIFMYFSPTVQGSSLQEVRKQNKQRL